jgi:hypothetical protein
MQFISQVVESVHSIGGETQLYQDSPKQGDVRGGSGKQDGKLSTGICYSCCCCCFFDSVDSSLGLLLPASHEVELVYILDSGRNQGCQWLTRPGEVVLQV